nr:MAG TPA: hypothetical protein [Caudoviricetes sp.]
MILLINILEIKLQSFLLTLLKWKKTDKKEELGDLLQKKKSFVKILN